MISMATVLVLLACSSLTIASESMDNILDNQCKNDDDKASKCLTCSSLEFNDRITFDSCCSDNNKFLVCDACVEDNDSCKVLMQEYEDIDEIYRDYIDGVDDNYSTDDYYDANDVDDFLFNNDKPAGIDVQKRYGKLFMKNPKRYGRIFFGKRDSGSDFEDMDKRFGRLYMGSGSYFGKRDVADKRFGRLYLGSGSYFGKRGMDIGSDDLNNGEDFTSGDVDKRYGQLLFGSSNSSPKGRRLKLFGKRDGVDSEFPQYDKRYGRLFTNGKYKFGKRDMELVDSDLAPFEKRYGSLFVSKFGKRDEYSDEEADGSMDKRFGRLYMNKIRLFSKPPKRLGVDKRFGRLFTGRRKYYFG